MPQPGDETARWSIDDRLALAVVLARIEASLKNQDSHLADLVAMGKVMNGRMRAAEIEAVVHTNRLGMHEKVVAGIVTAGGIAAAVWAFAAQYLHR